jgi:osmoprotectant transport system ATP-binding protein
MIDIDGLTRRYGDTTVVDAVTLQVRQGELLALVGGSGAGKTTLLKMINRLIEPTAGCVRLDGEDTRAVEPHTLRRRIGYVFQGVGLFPHWTVAENVAVPLTLEGWPATRIRQRVDEVLELVGLPAGVRERRPAELSGGQQQRVGVARALAASPRVMLLDEPFGALDPVTRDRLQQSLLDLKQRLGLTAILVTHDMTEALLLGDRLGVMRGGRLVQVGSPADLLRDPADAGVAALFDTPRRQVRVLDMRLGGRA